MLTDKLVFTNQMTFLAGGFFLDYQDFTTCGSTTYARTHVRRVPTDATCMFNIQPLVNRTTGYHDPRPEWRLVPDRAPVVGSQDRRQLLPVARARRRSSAEVRRRLAREPGHVATRTGAAARSRRRAVRRQLTAGCGDGHHVAARRGAAGLVPYRADAHPRRLDEQRLADVVVVPPGFVQPGPDPHQRRPPAGLAGVEVPRRLRAGERVRPDLLPQQCQDAADPNQTFNNFSPRVSATYDLSGNGKTSMHASYSYYFQSRITLANGSEQPRRRDPDVGAEPDSGACSTAANASCWTDLNLDGFVQANELIGTPTASTSRFDTATGILTTVPPVIDPNVQIGRTREWITGIDHELMPNMHVAVDYIYRYNDHGSTTYTHRLPAGRARLSVSALYTDRQIYTDPVTGMPAPYYTICQGCTRPTGTNITTTSLAHSTYQGVTLAVGKRTESSAGSSMGRTPGTTYQSFQPFELNRRSDGVEFTNGRTNGTARSTSRCRAATSCPGRIQAAANLGVQAGSQRTRTINGPGRCTVAHPAP